MAVDGEVYGAYLRRSADGHWVQNLSMGGTATPAHCGELERRLVQATSPHYARHGIHILGYDLLRDDDGQWTISEINAGNIGGLFRLEQMGAGPITDRFVRWLHRFAGAAFNERTG